MIGHLGSRVSLLLDGRLGAAESERAWSHVRTCEPCRDLVEREGALKRRLSHLSTGTAPAGLKGHLKASLPCGAPFVEVSAAATSPRRAAGIVTVGGGAVGAAVLGVLVLGVSPADAPSIQRRTPVTQLGPSAPAPVGGFTPASAPGPSPRR